MLSVIMKTPELEIDQGEAKRLSDATIKLNELYGGFMVSEKTMAWIELMMVGGAVYGPRYVAYIARGKKERAERKEPQTINASEPIKFH
jgi:hypothetical protein